jgi:hypothetical protein
MWAAPLTAISNSTRGSRRAGISPAGDGLTAARGVVDS